MPRVKRPFRRCKNCRDKIFGKESMCSKCKIMLYGSGVKVRQRIDGLEKQ